MSSGWLAWQRPAQAQTSGALHQHGDIRANGETVEANVFVVDDLFNLGTRALGILLGESVDNLSDGTFFVDFLHP